jgi:hypothetical protein
MGRLKDLLQRGGVDEVLLGERLMAESAQQAEL